MANDFIEDLMARRGKVAIPSNTVWMLEQNGAQVIIPTAFEPDPTTHRSEYYYNAITDCLYKKVTLNQRSVWKKVSE